MNKTNNSERFEIYLEIQKEIQDYMQLHNEDEVGQGDGAWSYEDAEYHLLLDDKYREDEKSKVTKQMTKRGYNFRNNL